MEDVTVSNAFRHASATGEDFARGVLDSVMRGFGNSATALAASESVARPVKQFTVINQDGQYFLALTKKDLHGVPSSEHKGEHFMTAYELTLLAGKTNVFDKLRYTTFTLENGDTPMALGPFDYFEAKACIEAVYALNFKAELEQQAVDLMSKVVEAKKPAVKPDDAKPS
jgi:hypothetical protein